MLSQTVDISNVSDGVDTCYSKLLLASPSQVQQIIDSENRDLQQQLKEEGEQVRSTDTCHWYRYGGCPMTCLESSQISGIV